MTLDELKTSLKDMEAVLKMDDLEKRFPGSVSAIRGFRLRSFSDEKKWKREERLTLADTAKEIVQCVDGKLNAFVIRNRMFLVENWQGVLATAFWFCVSKFHERTQQLLELDFFSWVYPARHDADKLLDDVDGGRVELHCGNEEEFVYRTQQLLLAYDISLSEAGVSYRGKWTEPVVPGWRSVGGILYVGDARFC